MKGSFSGIGVEFNIINDSIVVVSPISGGPSERLGIQSGDRIINVEKENVAGIGIKNDGVINRLRGEKGSNVNITIKRRGQNQPIKYNIVRDNIPLFSVDAGIMLQNNIGYIKINRFAATTYIEMMKKVNTQMNMKEVTICYGMTETSPVSFQSFVDDPIDKRCETVGRVHPHLEVKIVDNLGKIVPVDTTGEICTRGYSVMKGYWNDVARTNDVINDGWMHTGDLGVFDREGFCTITGRLKDMIIRGGENIYPREIEEFLFSNTKIREVQVFGVPDKKMGEEVCAWIVPMAGCNFIENELDKFCRGKIAHFKIPKYFEFVDELPMTITGKPQKFIMRDKMIEMLSTKISNE